MLKQELVLTPQEKRIEEGKEQLLYAEEGGIARARVNRMLKGFRDKPPRLAVERARLFTESFKETESLPIVLRWAKAMENIMANIEVAIGDEELLVGTCGPLPRYGLIYPELRPCRLPKPEDKRQKERKTFITTEEDIRVLNEEIIPYWEGKTLHNAYLALLPEETRRFIYKDDNINWKYIILESATTRHSLQWALDYEKVLIKGFNGIKREAEERLASLDVFDSKNNYDKKPFLEAVIIVCDAMSAFASRYAELARSLAEKETDERRKRELIEIADTCEWVPANPARNFREAVQTQWFTQVGSRFEQHHGGVIGNGRIDQYLYPYYEKDVKEGRITKDEALELIECLWLKMAQCVELWQGSTIFFTEGYDHFEQTVIGGQTRDGEDATNELSYLILQSKKEFPLSYPDLSARIHSQTPEPFLLAVCELIKEGAGFPKLFNDEEIIPLLVAKGATLEEARDYTGSGCTEVRMLNRDTYMTGGAFASLGAAIDMALNNGALRFSGEQIGVRTGDPRNFKTFDDFMNAFRLQVENIAKHVFIQQCVADMVRPQRLAAPLLSCLHDLCMQQCVDIQQGRIEGGLKLGNWDPLGLATAADSIAAVKKLVYDEKKITMSDLLEALDTNFDGKEELRQMLLNAPKYGNNDAYADSIVCELEDMFISLSRRHTQLYGDELDTRYVPVHIHVNFGAALGATPNGRKSREPLSDGVSPSQGCDVYGPTTTLLSVAKCVRRRYKERAARLFNMKFSPQAVAGEEGTRKLASFIRTWCDLKIWHIQFNIINAETLREAQKHPDKYRNLLVRVAGYSAYFVDLHPRLQEDIIHRTEHNAM
ncbi:glycyl radical protein [Chloroflexota bacterium]